jgi:predicted outer membrane protein
MELNNIIDDHIKTGKSLDNLMEKIENIMGDPDNLSAEFKEALPDLLKEMELTDD